MDQLRTIVENAQCNQDTFAFVKRQTVGILAHLGMSQDGVDVWIEENIRDKKVDNLAKWEGELRKSLEKEGVFENLDARMTERAKVWFSKIEPHLLQTKTLDLGGGSGEAATLMQKHGCDVTVADALNWLKEDMPFLEVKDNEMDVPGDAFDQVVLLTVFHHTDDVKKLVGEAFRVAKRRVIFIESVTENQLMYEYGAWIDWFYNHVLHYSEKVEDKINVPCNFLPARGWEQLVWKLTGLHPTVSKNLGFFQYLNPENHHLFVYDK